MKAIQAAHRGGYDALRLVDIPRPQPRAGQGPSARHLSGSDPA